MDRNAFLQSAPKRVIDVEITGIGLVHFCMVSGSDKIKYESWLRPGGKISQSRLDVSAAKLITLCVCDSQGDLILKDEDIPAIMEKPCDTLTQLSEVAFKCFGLSEEEFSDRLKKKFAT